MTERKHWQQPGSNLRPPMRLVALSNWYLLPGVKILDWKEGIISSKGRDGIPAPAEELILLRRWKPRALGLVVGQVLVGVAAELHHHLLLRSESNCRQLPKEATNRNEREWWWRANERERSQKLEKLNRRSRTILKVICYLFSLFISLSLSLAIFRSS